MTKYIINKYDIMYGWLLFNLGIFIMFCGVIYSDIVILCIVGLFLVIFGSGLVLYNYIEAKK